MFETITTSQSIVMIGIIFILTGTSAILRSPISLLFSGLTIVVFVSVIEFNVGLEIFWFSVMINALILGISLLVFQYLR